MTTTSPIEELSSYVPALILRRMAADLGATTAPAAERFPAAVLVADLSGFTALTEQLTRHNPAGAEELTRILDLYFGHLVRVVVAHGGDVVKFSGDGLLALWYGDEPLPALTQRAVQCGLAVQMMMVPDVWGGLDGAGGEPALKLRVGVGAGEVTTMYLGGVFGRWELLVAGRAVAGAAMAEAAARPGEVLIAPDAWPLVADTCIGAPASGAVRLESLVDYLPMRPLDLPPLAPEMADALRAYLPKAIVARLDAGQMAWLAELRRVTVLFINLPDLHADTPLREAQALLRALQSMLYRYEGSISRLGTDGKGPTLVAALGLPPLAHEDDAERGVRAALAIHAALAELGFGCAIGVTTGQALCGAVGGHARREYTMMGSIVNRSARLMQAAAADAARTGRPALLCDLATFRAVGAVVACEPLPPLALKGVAEPVPVFRPLAAPAAAAPSAAPPDSLAGRERERLVLSGALASLLDGLPAGPLIVEGEAGIGKSRLVAALRAEAEAAGVAVLAGAGSAMERAPLFAWRPVAARLLGLQDQAGGPQEPGPDGAAPLAATEVVEALGDLAPLAPLLSAVLPAELPDTPRTAQLVGQVRADNRRDLLLSLLERAAAAPLLLIFEDAHWLDASSWALLLAAAERRLPLLVVVVARPMVEPPAEFQRLIYLRGARHLRLRGLAAGALRELLARRLGVVEVPEPALRLIAERSQGNPFFAGELAFALRDSGALVVAEGRCRLADGEGVGLGAVGLPETVQGLITSRIDRLSPAQQLTLKVASAIGSSFALADLAAIHPVERERERLVEQLFALQQAGLVAVEVFEPDLLYAFRPAAAAEVAYNLMSFGQRRRLHQALALRGEAGGLAPAAKLAHHWRQANEPARAMRYLALAGEEALRGGAYREAGSFLGEALAIVAELGKEDGAAGRPDEITLARWERQLGAAFHGMGRLIESRELLSRAAARLGHPPPSGAAMLLPAIAGQLLRQVGHRLRPHPPHAEPGSEALLEAARAYATLSQLAYYDSRLLAALHGALLGLNLAERAGPSPERAGAYASAQVVVGPLAPLARLYRRRAQSAAAGLGHLPTLAWTAESHALYAIGHADWRGARAALALAIRIAEHLGDQRRRAECLALRCLVDAHRGHVREALAGCVEVEALGARQGDVQVRTWGLVGAAQNLLALGEGERAAALLGEAEGLLAENFDSARAEELWAYALMARAALRRREHALALSLATAAAGLIGRVPHAALYTLAGYSAVAEVLLGLWEAPAALHPAARRRLTVEARRVVRALGRFALIFPVARPATLLWRGLELSLRGRAGAARRCWARSADLARRHAMPYDEARAHLELGRHAAGPERRAHLDRAAAIFQRLGANDELAAAHAFRQGPGL